MLKIKRSHIDGKYVVYNPNNFTYHTHTPHKRIALKLKYLVEHHMMPTSKDIRFINSLLRLTSNRKYRRQLLAYKDSITNCPHYDVKPMTLGDATTHKA